MFLLLSHPPYFSSPQPLKLSLLDCKRAEKYSSHSICYPYTVLKGFDQKLIWAAKDHFFSDFPCPSLLFYPCQLTTWQDHSYRGHTEISV